MSGNLDKDRRRPPVDTDLLAELMAAFESAQDLTPDNPFEVTGMSPALLNTAEAFLESAVRDTAFVCDEMQGNPHGVAMGANPDAMSFAIAGLLQGFAIGFDYAERKRRA